MGLADEDKNAYTKCASFENKSKEKEKRQSLQCGGLPEDSDCVTGPATS